MKPIIAAIVTCAVLFGVSYYASSYYATMEAEPDETEVEKPEETVDPEVSTLPPNTDEIKQQPVTMQVGQRPERAVSLEAVLQMSDSVKRMEEDVIRRKQKVLKEEQRIQMMITDMETEQDELTAFAESVEMKVDILNKKTQELRDLLAQLEERKAEVAKLEKSVGVDADSKQQELNDKVEEVIPWFASLDPKQSSEYLKDFANAGKLEFVAELLNRLPDRQKSKILAELKDGVLLGQIVDALKVKPKAGQ